MFKDSDVYLLEYVPALKKRVEIARHLPGGTTISVLRLQKETGHLSYKSLHVILMGAVERLVLGIIILEDIVFSTNFHKLNGFKQQTFIIAQFPLVRRPAMAYLCPFKLD